MGEYLTFNKFITPAFVQVIFWIGVLGLIIYLIAGGGGYGGMGFGMRLVVFIFGLIFWRVYVEIILIFFKIYGELEKIEKNTSATTSA